MTLTKEELDDLFGTLAVQVETTVAASPEAVWDLLADVTRIGEFSPECKQAEWLDGATGAAVGARFAGYNQKGPREWTRPCTVTACDPPTRFSYVVGDDIDGSPVTDWEFEIAPVDGGSLVRQRFAHRPSGRSSLRLTAEGGDHAESIISWRRNDLREGMEATLAAMKAALERT